MAALRTVRRFFTAAIATVAFLEIAVQASGILDFPLYIANNEIGYIPAPNQSGSFLHFHEYRFNEYSMASGAFLPDHRRRNLLLIGDSIVLGGNPLDEADRLGPSLARATGWSVWPASAGSWALQNELTYLSQHANVVEAVDAVAIVSNSGDFGGPSSWASELTHPTRRPFPGLIYLFRKYLAPGKSPSIRAELAVAPRDWRRDLRDFASHANKPLYIFLYPDQEEQSDPEIAAKRLYCYEAEIRGAVQDHARLFRVAESSDWNTSLYRDGIHPTAEGNRVLARILAKDMIGAEKSGK